MGCDGPRWTVESETFSRNKGIRMGKCRNVRMSASGNILTSEAAGLYACAIIGSHVISRLEDRNGGLLVAISLLVR